MKRYFSAILVVSLSVVLGSCSVTEGYFDHLSQGEPFVTVSQDEAGKENGIENGVEENVPSPVFDQGLPPTEGAVLPPRDAQDECPYLPDRQWVSDTLGEMTLGQGLDTRFDTPACVFWSYNEDPSLQVIVRHFTNEDLAREAVDFYAPIDSTSPASKPAGWSGGRGTFPGMSVYAVQKGNMAVIAISNQEQTIKVQGAAEEAIKNLGI